MNELKSYTEYAVSTPTADFVIGFDFNYGEDAVNVTVDNVPANTAGYTVSYLNETTIRLSPSISSGVVRLQRETDIDTTDNQFTAGAKFTAQAMDENFEQLRHSQQEVTAYSTQTREIVVDTLDGYEQRIGTVEDTVDTLDTQLQTETQARVQGDLDNRRYTEDLIGMGHIWDGISSRSVLDYPRDKNQELVNDELYATVDDHTQNLLNPHQVTKGQVGLGNVDNTSDIDKPISTLTQDALDLKADQTYVDATINNSIATEAAARATADSVLQGQIDALGGGSSYGYTTYALMTADSANIPANSVVSVTNDPTPANNGTYQYDGTTFTKSDYDPLTQSKQYADNLLTSALSIATDLNTLEAGNYYLLSSNLNALVDSGDFITLGYPTDTVKGGGVKLSVVRKSTYTYQTIEFSSQGRILTRQGQVGAGFSAWISGARDAMGYTDNELNKKFGSVAAGTSLNTFINAGTWGISGFTASVDSRVPAMGYPESLAEGSAVLTVAQTASGYAVQELTHGVKKYKRILNRATGAVYEDWQVLTGVTDYAKKGVVATAESLDNYTTEGVYAISSTVLKAGIESGSESFPNFFTATGGAILIVAKVGNFNYQVIIGTRQKKIATRQGEGSNSWFAWVNTLDIVPTVKKTFLCFGSSSFEYMATKTRVMIESFSATYVSDAISGQILETMQAHQGSNPISIVFNDGVTALNNVASAVTVTQKDDIGSLTAKHSFVVTLSNGLKGTLNLNANTFTASNATEIYNVGSLSFDVDFGFFDYAQTAYHIFNIGKNNITMGYYTTQQVLDETNKMIDFIKNKGNQNFIVVGHFVDNGMVAGRKQVVLDVNAALKAKYGEKYFDMQDYLMSAQIWTDLNITPTQDDLDKQAVGELAASLGRDFNHLSAAVDTLMVARLKQKLQDIGYL